MSRYVVTDTDECADDPCKNNGTCLDLVNGYDCICVAGFNDTNCTNGMIYQIFSPFSSELNALDSFFIGDRK